MSIASSVVASVTQQSNQRAACVLTPSGFRPLRPLLPPPLLLHSSASTSCENLQAESCDQDYVSDNDLNSQQSTQRTTAEVGVEIRSPAITDNTA